MRVACLYVYCRRLIGDIDEPLDAAVMLVVCLHACCRCLIGHGVLCACAQTAVTLSVFKCRGDYVHTQLFL